MINLLGKNERLLSFGKPVLASKIANPKWAASNAVKLSNESDILQQCKWANAGSVAIGPGINKFWQVDLQGHFFITKVQVLGFDGPNNDGVTTYFNNVQINVCQDAQGDVCTNCNDSLLDVGERQWGVMPCSENSQGRYIRLVNKNTGGFAWHFCRVEVYGFVGMLQTKYQNMAK